MGLLVQSIKLVDFRNYEQAEFKLGPRLTVIGGPNAAGKTSVIEAIQLTTAGQSFRSPLWKETIRRGSQSARVTMQAGAAGRSLQVAMEVDPLGRRAYSVNGSTVRRVADMRGKLPSVVFAPDHLAIVKGSADRRRSLLDSLGDQLSGTYEALRKEYDRILKQRNAALKEGQAEVAEALAEGLVHTGAKYTAHRVRLLDRIRGHAEGNHEELTGGEPLGIKYTQPWAAGEGEEPGPDVEELEKELASGLVRTRSEEAARGTTSVGPHRDDIELTLGGVSARAFASQGQQRTIALSWKLAEVAVIRDVAGESPILLLDDVMSELDEERRAALVTMVDEDTQTAITTTNLHYFEEEILAQADILELEP